MKRCEENGMWSLMCPNECPGLQDCWGEKFEKLYERSAEYKESYSFYNSPSLMFYSQSFLVKSRGSVLHMQEKLLLTTNNILESSGHHYQVQNDSINYEIMK